MSATFDTLMATHFAWVPTSSATKRHWTGFTRFFKSYKINPVNPEKSCKSCLNDRPLRHSHRRYLLKNSSVRDHASLAASSS